MDVVATKKATLSHAPTWSGTKSQKMLLSRGRNLLHSSKSQIKASYDHSDKSKDNEEVSENRKNHNDRNKARNIHQSVNNDNRHSGPNSIVTNRNESYDSNRTRHFVIDRNDNLVVQPGEDNNAISNYEQSNLARLTDQATYGLGSLSKLANEDQGIQGFETHSSDSYEKANRPGLIAWAGPDNPGLPDMGMLKANDYTGQSTVDTFETPADNHPEDLPGLDKAGPLESLAKSPELQQATEELNAALDEQKAGNLEHKPMSYDVSAGRDPNDELLDGSLNGRVQFGKEPQSSKLEEKSRNDKESASDPLKLVSGTSDGHQREAVNGKEDSDKTDEKEGKNVYFCQNEIRFEKLALG